MKSLSALLPAVVLGFSLAASYAATTSHTTPEIVDQVLLNRGLEVTRDRDVIVDRVTVPPNTVLGRRWHPGEMFVYVMEGKVTVSVDGAEEKTSTKGELLEVPLRTPYSARTSVDGAELLIFRIHEANQPIRIMAD